MDEETDPDELGRITVSRRRLFVLAAVVAQATAVAVVGFVRAVRDQRRRESPTAATARDRALAMSSVLAEPHVIFCSTALGPTYGRVAAVPLADPGGPRAVSTIPAERVHAQGGTTVCLQADRGVVTTYQAVVLDAALRPVRTITLRGGPKPARVSSDGTLAAWTVIVVGTSCTDAKMELETVVEDLADRRSYGALEKTFRVLVDGRRMTAAIVNVWDVTFQPGPRPTRFYVTVSDNTTTWLAKGDLTTRTITAFHRNGQTPSLSPDGRTLVFVERRGASLTSFRLRALDLRTKQEWDLPEPRSVCDQVEWLDNTHVLYGVPRDGTAETDVWRAPLRGGSPTLFIPNAASPAVVRGG